MAVKKEGELRVRKGESIYGPMSREHFDQLLASGRIRLTDFVSVSGRPWVEILQFMSPPPPTGGDNDCLRVLRGDRIFGSLDLRRLRQLCAEGRVDGDDLVCALGGPWMPVADFLAPPVPAYETAQELLEAEVVEDELAEAEVVDEVEYVPLRWYHVYEEEVDPRQVDRWYIRVHGIHSAPLTVRQVRQLFFAREISGSSLARHMTWHEDFWKPIESIPELVEVLRKEGER